MGDQITGGYDPGTIAHFQAGLLTRRVEVVARLQRNGDPVFVEELNGTDWRNRPQVFERHNIEVAGDSEKLRDIERALQKCKEGTYGLCADCGTPILLARLEAIPIASRCVSCQAKHKSQNSNGKKPIEAPGYNPLRIFAKAESAGVGRRTAI